MAVSTRRHSSDLNRQTGPPTTGATVLTSDIDKCVDARRSLSESTGQLGLALRPFSGQRRWVLLHAYCIDLCQIPQEQPWAALMLVRDTGIELVSSADGSGESSGAKPRRSTNPLPRHDPTRSASNPYRKARPHNRPVNKAGAGGHPPGGAEWAPQIPSCQPNELPRFRTRTTHFPHSSDLRFYQGPNGCTAP